MKIRRKDILYYSIILLLILYIIFFDSYSFYQLVVTKKQLQEAEKKLNDLNYENERLRFENEKLANDKQTWEKKARELGMQKEGDEIYIFKKESR